MGLENYKFSINTQGFTDIIDITRQVANEVANSKQQNASVHVFVSGSTASITTVEYEPGLLKDLSQTLEAIAPINKVYHHDEAWHDGNGYAHIRAGILGASVNIPLVQGKLALGQWQQIVLIDFDNKSRKRDIFVQVIH